MRLEAGLVLGEYLRASSTSIIIALSPRRTATLRSYLPQTTIPAAGGGAPHPADGHCLRLRIHLAQSDFSGFCSSKGPF